MSCLQISKPFLTIRVDGKLVFSTCKNIQRKLFLYFPFSSDLFFEKCNLEYPMNECFFLNSPWVGSKMQCFPCLDKASWFRGRGDPSLPAATASAHSPDLDTDPCARAICLVLGSHHSLSSGKVSEARLE